MSSHLRYLHPGADIGAGIPGPSPLCLDVRAVPRRLSLCAQDIYLSKVGKRKHSLKDF